MYDPKFEKEIQRKMEELEFRPAESVWVNIEKAVVVKRRRRAGFVWRYLLPGVFFVAAAGLYLHYGHGNTAKTAQKNAGATIQPGGGATTAAAAGGSNDKSAGGDGAASSIAGGSAIANSSGPVSVSGSGAANGSGTNGSIIKRRGLNGHSSGDPENARASETQQGSATESETQQGSVTEQASATQQSSATEQSSLTEPGQGPATARDAGFVAGQKGIPQWFYIPGLAGQRLTPQVQGAALATKKRNMVALAGLAHPQGRWEAGFVAGGGWSKLNRLNVNQAKAALTSNATSLYTIAGSSSGKHYISDIQPDASFDGGIYLQRALSSRWIFNTGMNLHYYSNRISVGQQVTTYVQASASYFIPTTFSAQNTPMYSAGDTKSFTNKYYFLELPAGLQWKISKNHLLPIFLEGGVSLSRLMGASALFYNAKTGLYSKDGDIVNKTQFNVSSALLVGLPIHGIAMQLGPVVQYGLTPLVNTQGVGDQHFLYYGLRLVVIPGRK